jgi:muconate cycloisomerase
MRIERVTARQIETRRAYGRVSGHIIVEIHTDGGPVGLGEASDSRAEDLPSVVSQYNALLKGQDATSIAPINERLAAHDFASTASNHHLVSAIDLALYDLNGKALGVPAWRLMGGKFRDRFYFCTPIFGIHVRDDFDTAKGHVQRLVDMGHHLFRYYISRDVARDSRFLNEVFSRFGDQITLKQIDFQGWFKNADDALNYADALRHHNPMHFEQPSKDLAVSAEFTKRIGLPVSRHISDLASAQEAIERGACTAFNLTCIYRGPTYVRRLFAVGEAAGMKCFIGTDQESTLGIAAQLHLAASVPNLDLPIDPAGPVLYLDSPAAERIRAEGSYMYLPSGPGLGVTLDPQKLDALTVC